MYIYPEACIRVRWCTMYNVQCAVKYGKKWCTNCRPHCNKAHPLVWLGHPSHISINLPWLNMEPMGMGTINCPAGPSLLSHPDPALTGIHVRWRGSLAAFALLAAAPVLLRWGPCLTKVKKAQRLAAKCKSWLHIYSKTWATSKYQKAFQKHQKHSKTILLHVMSKNEQTFKQYQRIIKHYETMGSHVMLCPAALIQLCAAPQSKWAPASATQPASWIEQALQTSHSTCTRL